MKRLIALGTGIFAMLVAFFSATPAYAMCMGQVPVIGTVASVSAQGDTSIIALNNVWAYDASALPQGRTDIDAYNAIALSYKQNNFRLPQNLQPSNNSAPAGTAYQSFQDYVSQNYAHVSVDTAALGTITHHAGDIVIVGPPEGGACTTLGFTGFFDQAGSIESLVADDSSLLPYTYGSDTLSLATTTATNCSSQSILGSAATTCDVPIQYALNSDTFTLAPAQSKTVSTGAFTQINLISSTHTALPPNTSVEDFSSDKLVHTINFAGTASAPSVAALRALIAILLRQLEALSNARQGNPDTSSISVSLGSRASVPQTKTLTISWTSFPATTTPAAVKLSLYSAKDILSPGYANGVLKAGTYIGDIAGGQAANGSYDWQVPDRLPCGGSYAPDGCAPVDSSTSIVSWLNPAQYVVVASLYTPSNAQVIFQQNPSTAAPSPLYLAAATSSPFEIVASSTPAGSTAACLRISHNLFLDQTDPTTDGDVSKLQNFLIQAGYMDGATTGYFGPHTLRALQAWQLANGVVSSGTPESTGFGYAGPRTRAALSAGCAGDGAGTGATNPTVNFSAAPLSGAAPLTVTFSANVPDDNYSINYGDGTSGWVSAGVQGGGDCAGSAAGTCTRSTVHAYASPGTYTASLTASGAACGVVSYNANDPFSLLDANRCVVATLVINVGTSSGTSDTATPSLMTGTLVAPACTLSAGAATCAVMLSYTGTNQQFTDLTVYQNGIKMQQFQSGSGDIPANSGSQSVSLAPGTYQIQLAGYSTNDASAGGQWKALDTETVIVMPAPSS